MSTDELSNATAGSSAGIPASESTRAACWL